MRSPIPLLIRMKNNNPGFLSSRGDNFLFKNIYFFKIHQKFKKLENFEIFDFQQILKFLKFWKFWNFWNFWTFWFFEKNRNFWIFEIHIFKKILCKIIWKNHENRNFDFFRKFWSKIENFSFFIFFFKMCQKWKKSFFSKTFCKSNFRNFYFF
mgnify:CR=1 FL=1